MVGASGAIAGHDGCVLRDVSEVAHRRAYSDFIFIQLVEVPAACSWGCGSCSSSEWRGVSMSPGSGDISGGIAFWAHVAGFVTGTVVFAFRRPERQRVEWWHDRET